MSLISRFGLSVSVAAALVLSILLTLSFTSHSLASGGEFTQLSSDPYTNTTSQHQTEVEPDNYASGSTIVNVFQVGRFANGGASNNGWATSTDNGKTWQHGFFPGTTVYATPKGIYARISDPAVVYDAKDNTWLASGLAILNEGGSPIGAAVLVNRSTDGGLTWSNPVTVVKAPTGVFLDKDWIVCDDSSTSSFYGHCYVEWDIASKGDLLQMSTSTNGGKTWGAGKATAGNASGLGGQPLVQPNGTVIVPFLGANIEAFTSTDGGNSWANAVLVGSAKSHLDAGNLRSGPLPSAEIDGSGKVYVAWENCQFEKGCSTNDIVLSTSTNGTTWSATQRVPIDPVGSGVDDFLPGLGLDKTTSGSSAHIGLVYYYYPVSNCTISTCQLDIGFISSTNGGKSWSPSTELVGPMQIKWLASTTGGYMVGDYFSTTFVNGNAFPVFAIASAPQGKVLNEAMFTVTGGIPVTGGSLTAAGDHVYDSSAQPAQTVSLTAY